MKVIFLDIDGVLNHMGVFPDAGFPDEPIAPECVARLRQIVDATGAKIVLSSSWRTGWFKDTEEQGSSGEVLNRVLAREGLEIFDKTGYKDSWNRSEEVIEWMQQAPEPVESFIILDDCDYYWKDYCMSDYWIESSFMAGGLLERHVERAIHILNHKIRFLDAKLGFWLVSGKRMHKEEA